MVRQLVILVILSLMAVLTACVASEPAVKVTMTPGEWDYVFLGDSTTNGYPWLLKAGIEADFGGTVTVAIQDWHRDGQTSNELLQTLQTDERLREAIRNAELITVMIPWGGCAGAFYVYDARGSCGGDDNQDCLRDCLTTYKADATAIFSELVNLRSPSEALIRAHDVYQFRTSDMRESGSLQVVNGYWREGNAHVHTAAGSHDIPVADVYEAFMGEDGIQPPEDNGLVQLDKIHTTPDGQRLIADFLRDLGYELAAP